MFTTLQIQTKAIDDLMIAKEAFTHGTLPLGHGSRIIIFLSLDSYASNERPTIPVHNGCRQNSHYNVSAPFKKRAARIDGTVLDGLTNSEAIDAPPKVMTCGRTPANGSKG
ncbi:hypothetical protein V2G26_019599 [Clonostachys chloroleuca]